jgi:alkanesulfonate monooxygenase SsuD/methylene tetrahydromethanopterin reductase-like flavin-dependent oxidoreductase (luciferase family)
MSTQAISPEQLAGTGGKVTLGVGTGEAPNEHMAGLMWLSADERLDMLDEAVHLIRELPSGRLVDVTGTHYKCRPRGWLAERGEGLPSSVVVRSSP